jgi:hypothetical protein
VWQLHQVIGAHEPDEAGAGKASAQRRERIGGVAGVQMALNIGGDDVAPIGNGGSTCQPRGKRLHAGLRLQWIARGNQQPHLIQAQALQRGAGNVQVAIMRRIEAAAQQADAHAAVVAKARQGALFEVARRRP